MGIYDRDYIRSSGSPGGLRHQGGGGIRGWSVTTWLIALCIAVFVTDTFLPGRVVMTGPMVIRADYTGQDYVVEPINYSAPDPGARIPQAHNVRRYAFVYRPVHSADTGEHIGWARGRGMHFIESYLHFSTALGFQRFEFWRLIGFQFLHSHETLAHILFNMIGLYFFGPMIERYLGGKRFLAFYLLCGIFGALLYALLNLTGFIVVNLNGPQIPGLLFNDPHTPLIGASAGVFGVIVAGAFLNPRATVLLFFILPLQLGTLAVLLVAVSLISLLVGVQNAGGEAGHLGGALAGYYFIRNPQHLHGFFDFLGRVDPTSKHYRGTRRIARHRSSGRGEDSLSDRDIDRILSKINRSGLQSLTDEEKRILREASREDRY